MERFSEEYVVKQVKQSSFYEVVAVALLAMVVANTAFGDTYNFYFDKKKGGLKQGPVTESTEQDTQDVQESEQEASPAPTEQAYPAQGQQGRSNAPIVIHNNVSMPQATPTTPMPLSSGHPDAVPAPVASSYAVVPAPIDPYSRRPQWKFGLSLAVAGTRSAMNTVSQNRNYDFGTYYNSYEDNYGGSTGVGAGAMLTMGYRFKPSLGMNFYLGGLATKSGTSTPLLGLDVEWLPIRLDVGGFDLIEVGALAGVGTNIYQDATGFLGARFNLNLGPHFSLTSAVRLNASYTMADAGIAINL